MMYYPMNLYDLALEHQQQLRNQAQQDRLARQAAADAMAEHTEKMLSRGGSVLKAKGKARHAPAGRSAAILSASHPCPMPEGAQHPH